MHLQQVCFEFGDALEQPQRQRKSIVIEIDIPTPCALLQSGGGRKSCPG
jgi:hypothetical protein